MRLSIAVFASGGGTNLQALFDHLDSLGADRPAEVTLVVSDRAAAGALARARARGVEAVYLDREQVRSGPYIEHLLASRNIGIVVLAGYLRKIPDAVVRAYSGRMLNVHPALLPAFGGQGMYGAHVHAAVIAAGEQTSGVTVHLVSDEYDQGEIIGQWPVPVLEGDDAATLGARVLETEHVVFPRAIVAFAVQLTSDK